MAATSGSTLDRDVPVWARIARARSTTCSILVSRRSASMTASTPAEWAKYTIAGVLLVAAGGLLTWGSNFADDYVGDELAAQNIFFPDQAALEEDGRADLVQYADEQVTTGSEAEAYASYIDGHLASIADGATYADLGAVERAANAAVEEAQASGADEATVSDLQADADAVAGQRNSLFKGETLRGLLLSTFAWSTIGNIAGIGALVAFVAAGAMIVLVGLGIIHRRKLTTS